MRGTSGDLRHPRQSRYRCSLPGLAGFAGPRCTEPEVPRFGSRAVSRDCDFQSNTARILGACSGPLNSALPILKEVDYDFGFAVEADAAASGGCTSAGFTQFTLNGPAPCTWTMVSPLLR